MYVILPKMGAYQTSGQKIHHQTVFLCLTWQCGRSIHAVPMKTSSFDTKFSGLHIVQVVIGLRCSCGFATSGQKDTIRKSRFAYKRSDRGIRAWSILCKLIHSAFDVNHPPNESYSLHTMLRQSETKDKHSFKVNCFDFRSNSTLPQAWPRSGQEISTRHTIGQSPSQYRPSKFFSGKLRSALTTPFYRYYPSKEWKLGSTKAHVKTSMFEQCCFMLLQLSSLLPQVGSLLLVLYSLGWEVTTWGIKQLSWDTG